MKKYLLLIHTFFLIGLTALCQTNKQYSSNSTYFSIPKTTTVNVRNISTDWKVNLQNLESPLIGNNQYQQFLHKIKKESAKRFPRKRQKTIANNNITFNADTPKVLNAFEGNVNQQSVPNDNTLAVSNGNMIVSAINTNIWFYDLNEDSLKKTISLSAFSDTLSNISNHQYDPKLIYDPQEDRFIIVFLAGSSANSTTDIVVGFSQTNDPLGDWNLYSLPGNPLNDTSWTDYPALAITQDELFITGNLLKYGGPWQTSFKQSVVWQIDKFDGYFGDSLASKCWSDIKFGGHPVRNIHPVKGGGQLYTPDIYLLSNRNFDIQNDTIFLIHISDVLSNPNSDLTVNAVICDITYGMPPDARQDNNFFLATNDARVLGAFYQNSQIQFVQNTIDTTSGFAAVYHGIITGLNTSPIIHGNIISDTLLDFGYPNISYTGKSSTDNQAIITFNHTSPETHAGFSGLFYKKTDEYSPVITMKEGGYYIHVISGNLERWGDYSGSQRKYNEDGKVWVVGSYAIRKEFGGGVVVKGFNGTWIAELESPVIELPLPPVSEFNAKAYPNPPIDIMYVEFNIPDNKILEISIYDINGREIKKLLNREVKAGRNILSFSTYLLNQGLYFVVIKDKSDIVFSQKFLIKQ